VEALALTPDGGTIYALLHQRGRIVELDAATGAEIGRVPGGGYERLVAAVPW
jgi:DNA-binding beta-propeller fold protein YncE